MKKIVFVLAVAALFTACNNSTESKTEKTDSTASFSNPDSTQMNDSSSDRPSHGMMPLDTSGRRPRD